MIFDSHAHLDDKRFDDDREDLILGLEAQGIKYVLNPGYDRESSEAAVKLAQTYDNIYGAVGTHPHDAKDLTGEDLARYRDLAREPRVLAIGEIGFDFHYDNSPRKVQEEAFRVQMDLAKDLDLPVLIHMREATKETLEVLKAYQGQVRGIIHCYSEGWEEAKKFLDLGYLIGLGGVVTFKRSDATREVASKVPLDLLVLETDAPYLSPEPYRGRRNEPAYTKFVAEKIADLRSMDKDSIGQVTMANTLELLGL